jgi:hypothetical protein
MERQRRLHIEDIAPSEWKNLSIIMPTPYWERRHDVQLEMEDKLMKQLGEPVGIGSDVRPQHTVLQAPQPRTERQMLSDND